jgi:hypothetical protein
VPRVWYPTTEKVCSREYWHDLMMEEYLKWIGWETSIKGVDSHVIATIHYWTHQIRGPFWRSQSAREVGVVLQETTGRPPSKFCRNVLPRGLAYSAGVFMLERTVLR